MRFTNVRIIAEVEVHMHPDNGAYYCPAARYEDKRKKQPKENDWFNWSNTDTYHLVSGGLGEHGFTAAVVSYDADPGIRTGLNRRESLSMLKRTGLRPLTHLENFLLASEEIILGNLCLVMRPTYNPTARITMKKNPHVDRYIASPVSINVEFPFYYLFNIYGIKGREQFLPERYDKAEDTDNLYFGQHYKERIWSKEKAFPMILGVRPESVNKRIMPAKKKITFGATASPFCDAECYKCHNKPTIFLDSNGGGVDLQCENCDTVFWYECHQ